MRVAILAGLLLVLAACGEPEPYGGMLADLPADEQYAAIDAAYDLGYAHGKDAVCALAASFDSPGAEREWDREGRAEHAARRNAARAVYIDPELLREYDSGYSNADAEVAVDMLMGGSPCGWF